MLEYVYIQFNCKFEHSLGGASISDTKRERATVNNSEGFTES